MIGTMIFTTRCAGCDTPGATLCRTCRFALVSPPDPGGTAGRARGGPVLRPGPRRAARVQVPQPAGRSPATSPACSSTAWPGRATRRRRHVGADERTPATRSRGFDQAELVARQVARQLGVPCRRLLERDGRRPAADRAGPRRPGSHGAGVPGPPARAPRRGCWWSTTSSPPGPPCRRPPRRCGGPARVEVVPAAVAATPGRSQRPVRQAA